jgi:uncharacterized protein YggE
MPSARVIGLTLSSLLALIGRAAAHDAGAGAATPSTIRVVAEASAVVKPDLAVLELGVTTDKPTAEAATAENARKMEAIVAALKKEVGAGGEVKTVGFNVFPRYGEPRRGEAQPPIASYMVSNTVRVQAPDVSAAGRIIDRAFKLGANTVNRVTFTLKDPEPAQTEALRAAAAKARARATAMAAPLGLRVAHVLSIAEGREAPIPFQYDGAEGGLMATARATPLEAGSLEVRATVTVIFAIAGR